MFTGIVEEIGIIKQIKNNSLGLDIDIQANEIFSDLKIGDSVSVNGCCQTVTKISNNIFSIQAVSETVNLTNFKDLKINSEVNLERALTLNSRLGGHIVSGHIDGIGKVISIENRGNSIIFQIYAPENIMKYLIYKGSVTINGVSLTICELNQDNFKVSIIPHTFANTTFKDLKINSEVNLEPDILAKYIEKLLGKQDNAKKEITLEFLQENGF